MNKAFLKKWWPAAVAGLLVVAIALTAVLVFLKDDGGILYDNETDPLVFSTLEVDT